jgi:sulfur relay (sulfurtransferase) DsrF/TusC family protein
MKALNIIEAAYRGTLEEQDDTIVWITHALKGAGADLNVLLRGNAVNYGVKDQQVDGLKFGDREQKHGPDIAGDVAGLIGKGIEVYIVGDDLEERGIAQTDLIDGLKSISRAELPGLLDAHDLICHW